MAERRKRQSGIDPRIRQRRVAIARRQGRRRLRIVIAVAIIVVVVAGGFGLLHTGFFSAKKVAVTGSHPHTPTATILSVAGLAGHPPLISVNSGAVAAKLERLPWIASARVSRNWPDHVTIAVTERVAVAPWPVRGHPGRRWTGRAGRCRWTPPGSPAWWTVAVQRRQGPRWPRPGSGHDRRRPPSLPSRWPGPCPPPSRPR